MALLIFTCSTAKATPLLGLPTSSQSNLPSTSNSACSSLYRRKAGGLQGQILNGPKTCLPPLLKEEKSSRLIMCKASEEGADAPPSSKETGEEGKVVAAVDEKKASASPSDEEKLQLKLEQKVRMKLAKKLRLKRKRLVRKRHLRKKGRWPPSKMKKHQNV